MVHVSYIAQNLLKNYMRIISQGSILILAFHLVILYPAKNFALRYMENNELLEVMVYVIVSILICVFFIPIIRFVQKYVPILIGKR